MANGRLKERETTGGLRKEGRSFISAMAFIVEGSVGVGKSSVLEVLRRRHPTWSVLEEPVQQWQCYSPEEGLQINFLADFYDNPCERSFRLLQTQIFTSLLERYSYAKDHPAEVIVYERSVAVAKEVFMETHAALGRMPELEQLRDLASWAVCYFETSLRSVYLKCTPEVMLERIIGRSRSSENQVNAVELCKIQTRMNKWAKGKRMFTIDCTHKNPEEVADEVEEWNTRTC